MKIKADLSTIESIGGTLQETAREIERIRSDAEQQLTALLPSWQGVDSQTLQETFYAPGGLNEFSKRMTRGYLAFSNHLFSAARTYASVSNSLAKAESDASAETLDRIF